MFQYIGMKLYIFVILPPPPKQDNFNNTNYENVLNKCKKNHAQTLLARDVR